MPRKTETQACPKKGVGRPTRKPESVHAGRKIETAGDDSYFGGKGSCFRHLVNQIPPHDWLIVPFAGHCAITRNMQLPAKVWLNDSDVEVFRWWGRHLEEMTRNGESEYSDRIERISQENGIDLLEALANSKEFRNCRRPFVYLDPPYMLATRKSGPRYRCEMTAEDHERMLYAATGLPCPVMISGYWSELYAKQLADWRSYSFQSQTRGRTATEWVWCNYAVPSELQDYRWLGRDRRERFKLQRRAENLIAKLSRFPEIERNAMLAAVDSHFGGGRSQKGVTHR